jgi:hypothetical protein
VQDAAPQIPEEWDEKTIRLCEDMQRFGIKPQYWISILVAQIALNPTYMAQGVGHHRSHNTKHQKAVCTCHAAQ